MARIPSVRARCLTLTRLHSRENRMDVNHFTSTIKFAVIVPIYFPDVIPMIVPIVYIHGFIGRLDVPELTEAFEPGTALVPDLLGYGDFAEEPPIWHSVDQQAAHLAQQIVDAFGTTPVLLIGHSGGAAIGIKYALRYPERVAAFVSAEGNLSPSNAFLSSKLAAMTEQQVSEWRERALQDPVHGLGLHSQRVRPQHVTALRRWLRHQPGAVLHRAARALLSETVRPGYVADVEKVMRSIPTYLLCGEHSTACLDAVPSVLRLAADFHVIPDAGHAMLLESPNKVVQYLTMVRERIGSSCWSDSQP